MPLCVYSLHIAPFNSVVLCTEYSVESGKTGSYLGIGIHAHAPSQRRACEFMRAFRQGGEVLFRRGKIADGYYASAEYFCQEHFGRSGFS